MITEQNTAAPTAMDFTLSDAEHTQAYNIACAQLLRQMSGGTSRLARLKRVALAALISFAFTLAASYWLRGTALLTTVIGMGVALGAIDVWVRLKKRQRHMQSLWRERLGDQLAIRLNDAELNVVSVLGETAFRWSAVRQAQIVGPFVLIQLPGASFIPVPLRAFSSEAAVTAFVTQINARARDAALATPPTDTQPDALASSTNSSPKPAASSFLSELGHNLRAGMHLTLLRSQGLSRLRPGVGQVFALLLLATVVGFIAEFAQVGPAGQFEWMGLRSALVALMICVATAWVAVAWGDTAKEQTTQPTHAPTPTLLHLTVGLAALWLVFEVLSRLREADTHWHWIRDGLNTVVSPQWAAWSAAWWTWGSHWMLWLWFVLAVGLTAARALEAHRLRKVGGGLSAALAAALTTWTVGNSEPLWSPRYDAEAAQERAAQWQNAATEAVVYRQPQLLKQALDAVEPGHPGKPELYYIGLAGTGYQDVFANEVEGVEKLLQQRFGAQGHGVLLVNANRTPLERPFASATALEQALNTLAQRMNGEEDVLFLFMTSHGSRKHEFQIDLWPYRFDAITPERLRALLDASGIKNRVIVVSACYAGGFVPALANPDTLVIAAARADRTSFGCEDGKAWTYFGEAYFAQALARTSSFEQAFHIATQSIAQREQLEKRNASEPQMQVGERIRERLRLIETAAIDKEKS